MLQPVLYDRIVLNTRRQPRAELTESSSRVSEKNLEIGVAVEGSREDETSDGEGGFEGESSGELKDVSVLDVASIVHLFVSNSVWRR